MPITAFNDRPPQDQNIDARIGTARNSVAGQSRHCHRRTPRLRPREATGSKLGDDLGRYLVIKRHARSPASACAVASLGAMPCAHILLFPALRLCLASATLAAAPLCPALTAITASLLKNPTDPGEAGRQQAHPKGCNTVKDPACRVAVRLAGSAAHPASPGSATKTPAHPRRPQAPCSCQSSR